jgi:predicted AlkP superfamily phosphohydrolase/phosphomutase
VLRLLASAGLAALLAAAVLATLALYLNPALGLRGEAPALLVSLVAPWTLLGTVAAYGVAAALGLLRWWVPRRPVVPRRPFLVLLTFLALSIAAALYWSNLSAYRDALPVETLRSLTLSAATLTAAALVLLAVGVDRWLFPESERPAVAALVILTPALALAVPLALRPRPSPPAAPVGVRLEAALPARRVFVVGISGLGVSDVTAEPSAAPVLARLARRGAIGSLATLRPTEAPPLWTTLVTGRYPRDHGVLSAATYRLTGSLSEWSLLPKGAGIGLIERTGLVVQRPVASTARRRRALWSVLDAFGAPSGLVRVWGTQPPEAIQGFVVSPYFHLLSHDPEKAAAALHPRDLLNEVAARTVRAPDLDPALLLGLLDGPPAQAPLDDPRLRALAQRALGPDLSYKRAADALVAAYRPMLLVIDFQGYDAVGHSFYRDAHPEAFGNVPADDARRYGRVLERYLGLLGSFVGELERQLEPGDVLLVVSPHGLEPTPLWRRLAGVLTGSDAGTATHAAGPPGLLLAYGAPIRPGAVLSGASILDVAPTLLYLLGLPVARDMEGRVLTELLDPSYAQEHPVTFIPSYEGLAVAPAVPQAPELELPPLPDEKP